MPLSPPQSEFVRKYIGAAPETPAGAAAAARADGIAEGIVAKRRFLISRWQRIPGELKAELDGFARAVAAEFPRADAAGLSKAISRKLGVLVALMQRDLAAAIDDAVQSGDPDYKSVATTVARLRKRVAGDPLVKALRGNTLTGGQGFEAAFLSALDDVKSALTARA